MTGKKPPKSFEQAMERLESIVADLESGDFPLEESLKKFEEGFALGKYCRDLLDRAQVRVEQLVGPDSDGKPEERLHD